MEATTLAALRQGSPFELALDAIEEFRRIEPDMPIQFVAGYLAIVTHYVAHEEWPRIEDVRGLVAGLTQQSASRIAQGLGDDRGGSGREELATPRRRAGLGLIVRRPDPSDGRVVRLELSPKGEALLSRLVDIIA